MKEELISLKTVKLAKEKGFDFTALLYRDSNTLQFALNWKARLEYNSVFENPEQKSNLIKLPTQSLLQKWLREKYNIIVFVAPVIPLIGDYAYTIATRPSNEINAGIYASYEETLERGLFEALKLIKEIS